MDLFDLDVLIWDIDGVLIYVKDSYRKAIIETTQYYFSKLIGMPLDNYLISTSDTQCFKYIEGFNDDWKLTYACILCLLSKMIYERKGVLDPPSLGNDMRSHLAALKTLQPPAGRIDMKIEFFQLTRSIARCGVGLDGTEKALKELYGEKVVESAKKYWFTDIIKKVFQEQYLGGELFKKKYNEEPVFFPGVIGFIKMEEPIVKLPLLEKLVKGLDMGVATGRDRFEAEYSLKISGYALFLPKDVLVSSEDVSHGKPDPESLLLCKKKIEEKHQMTAGYPKAGYIGDSVDDVRAAKNAGFFSIGVLSAVREAGARERLREEYIKLECDLIIDDANGLLEYIKV